jgi:hypothetical protein
MAAMTLSQAEVTALAGRVTDLVGSWLPRANVRARIDPSLDWGSTASDGPAVTVYFDVGPDRSDSIGVWVPLDDDAGWALFRMVEALDELSETSTHWGEAFPRCAVGHTHAARVDTDPQGVALLCPQTGEVVDRVSLPLI